MERTNNETERAVQTANETLEGQNDNLSTHKVERVKSFRKYAFEKSGLNRGDLLSLKTYLKWIKDGHLVDETYNENAQHFLKEQFVLTHIKQKHSFKFRLLIMRLIYSLKLDVYFSIC
jgi:hypothetical protein